MGRVKAHSKELINAFKPVRYFLTAIGQMPFEIKVKPDGSYAIRFRTFGKKTIIFVLILIVTTMFYLTLTFGIIGFIIPSLTFFEQKHMIIVQNPQTGIMESKKWENYWVQHEMMPVMVVWSWQTIAFLGSGYLLFHGKYYVHFFNYWNRVVQLMDMDVTHGVNAYLHFNNLVIFISAGLLITAYVCQYLPGITFYGVSNTAQVVAHFFFRPLGLELMTIENKHLLQLAKGVGIFIMVYSFIASRANILQFLFFTLLLRNGCRIWNERLRNVLRHVDPEEDGPPYLKRLEFRQALKDHLILVQMFKMTENVFELLLKTYYSLVIVAIIMELYQLAALGGFGSATKLVTIDHYRPSETKLTKEFILSNASAFQFVVEHSQDVITAHTAIVCSVLVLNNLLICYRTTVDAGKAYQEAQQGFDILRRHGLMYCINKSERNFILSLNFSFARNNPMQITAGGYFAVNKALIVGMISAVLNWAISVYQTQVDQWEI